MANSIFSYQIKDVESDIISSSEFESHCDELKLLRLLYGGLDIVKNNEEVIPQPHNYLVLMDNINLNNINPNIDNFLNSMSSFKEFLIEESIITEEVKSNFLNLKEKLTSLREDREDTELNFDEFIYNEFSIEKGKNEFLKKYFNFISRNNKQFQEVILFETTMCLVKLYNSPITAFLHLYRILELMTFNVPLVYTSKQSSYIGAYNDLRKFFSQKGQEFVFFKKFLETLFKDEIIILDQEFSFEINSNDIETIKKDITKIYPLEEKNVINWDFEIINGIGKCKISFKNVIDLVVNIRNRYFHLNDGSGQPNIKNKTYELDQVLLNLNHVIINCFAIILLNISKHSFEYYSLVIDE